MDLRGYWQLRPLDATRTEVTFMLDVDPKTSVPAFLVDPQLQDVAVETLRGLERQAGKLAQQAGPRAASSGGR
jgi:ribosome-associated toxin RatA of RatAB toxin-antitoxin module